MDSETAFYNSILPPLPSSQPSPGSIATVPSPLYNGLEPLQKPLEPLIQVRLPPYPRGYSPFMKGVETVRKSLQRLIEVAGGTSEEGKALFKSHFIKKSCISVSRG